MDAVSQVGHSWEGRGVGKCVGGEGELVSSCEGGDDVLIVGPHVGGGEPDGLLSGVVFVLCDDGG